MFARIFGELGKDDSALAGGKGASLGTWWKWMRIVEWCG